MTTLSEAATYLTPIEHPSGVIMKVLYYFTRKVFGKVPTPFMVHTARMPLAFGQFYRKIGRLDKKLSLAKETVFLIRTQVARLNVCLFCIDIGRWFAMKSSVSLDKFDALNDYRTNSIFSEAERALLDYVTELTKEKKVSPEQFSRLARHFSEREICEIVYVVASEHVYNLTNLGLNIHSDMLCDISKTSVRAPASLVGIKN